MGDQETAVVEVDEARDEVQPDAMIEDDVLVEEVSIDGMCGVY
ncbi:MAG TPA: mycofactocin precursor MftA [Jatrophihabitantaceae bacterium]|jgi:mycofactocin precursor